MSKFQGFCPCCGERVPQERFVGGLPVCECGWSDHAKARDAIEAIERKTSIGIVVFSLFVAAFFAHVSSWGSHAYSIPALKLAAWTGTLSAPGYRELAQDCLDLGKVAAAEQAYLDMYRSGRDVEGLALLASLQARQGKTQPAAETYSSYFQANGKSPEAMVGYGKALQALGQIDEALKRFDEAAANTNLLPVDATTAAVRLLIQQRRLEEAYSRVLLFHASAENARGYLNSERASLEEWLGPKTAAALQAKAVAPRVAAQ